MLASGQRVAGRYRIESELGRGGMGTVYLAFDEKFATQVALKTAAASGRELDGFKERFVREARIGNRLGKHAGFVRALDWGELGENELYLTMDLVQGAQPLDLVTGSISERMQRLVLAARLVALAHAEGVIHRDLKPQNFLIDKRGTTWLTDFGIAKVVGEAEGPTPAEMTQTGSQMGTPVYMAPEQLEDSKHVDERADVYSLGVMMFRALTGRVPFDGATPTAIGKRHQIVQLGKAPMPTARGLDPSVPAPLSDLCTAALALEPVERIPLHEFVARLVAWLADKPAEEYPATLVEKRPEAKPEPSYPPTLGERPPASAAPPTRTPPPSTPSPTVAPAVAQVPVFEPSFGRRAIALIIFAFAIRVLSLVFVSTQSAELVDRLDWSPARIFSIVSCSAISGVLLGLTALLERRSVMVASCGCMVLAAASVAVPQVVQLELFSEVPFHAWAPVALPHVAEWALSMGFLTLVRRRPVLERRVLRQTVSFAAVHVALVFANIFVLRVFVRGQPLSYESEVAPLVVPTIAHALFLPLVLWLGDRRVTPT